MLQRGRCLVLKVLRKSQPVDQNALNEIRSEMEFYKKYQVDSNTEAGKNLIQLMDKSINQTIDEFVTKEVDKFDSDAKMIFFLASCRSKLQTLFGIKKIYTESEKKFAELSQVLQQILPKEE